MKVSDGKWHHVALVSDGRKHRLFIDGHHKGEGDLHPRGAPEGSVEKIGFTAIDFPNPKGFTGQIDELCIYDRMLEPNEIIASSTKQPKGLVGHLRLDGSGRDSSPKGNNARVTAGAQFVRGKFVKALQLNKGKGAMIVPRRR